MSNKKKIIISIISIILLVLLVVGLTYAFFLGRTNEEDTNATAGKLDVSYNITENITGTLAPSTKKEDGLTSVAVAKLNTGSVSGAFNIYITPTVLDNELKITALKWDVDVVDNNVVINNYHGDFSSATLNNSIKIVDAYNLNYTDLTFNIYIWVDAGLLSTSLVDKNFKATITADSVPITGTFES